MFKARVVDMDQVLRQFLKDETPGAPRELDETKLSAAVADGLRASPGIVVEEVPDPSPPRRRGGSSE